MTCAFWSAAQTMPFATHSLVPLPLSPRTLPFKMTASWPAPATPVPLFVEAAAVPATWGPVVAEVVCPVGRRREVQLQHDLAAHVDMAEAVRA